MVTVPELQGWGGGGRLLDKSRFVPHIRAVLATFGGSWFASRRW